MAPQRDPIPSSQPPMPHERPCTDCRHAHHQYLPCECGCQPHPFFPGDYPNGASQ